jgi:O-antigen ligase
VFGIGYGNWIPYYRSRYDPEGQVVHNIYLEAGTEMGYIGFFLLLFGLTSVFVINYRTRRIAVQLGGDGEFFVSIAYGLDAGLFGFMVAGFFVTVLYYPFFWIQLALTVALHTAAVNTRRKLRKAGVPLEDTRKNGKKGRTRGPAPRRLRPPTQPVARYVR